MIAELAGSYLAALNRPLAEFKPDPDGFVPKDIALIDTLLRAHGRVRITLDNALTLFVSHSNSRATRYHLTIQSPQLKITTVLAGGAGPVSVDSDPPARDLGLRIHKDLGRRTFLNLFLREISDLSAEELRRCLNLAHAYSSVEKREPERPLFYGAGWPSLVPGDIGVNPPQDIAHQFRAWKAAARQHLRRLRYRSLREGPHIGF